MKKFLLVLAGVVVVGTLAVVIALLPGSNKVTVLKAEMEQAVSNSSGVINRQLEVDAGDTFVVSLYADWASDLKWSASLESSGIVKQEAEREYTNDGPAFSIDSAGHEVWTFEALSAGQATITMTYGSVAESADAPQNVNTLLLAVTVG